MRRMNNKNTYEVTTERGRYAVTLERRKNDVNGNPRFSANIIVLHIFGDEPATGFFYTPVYSFQGHYCNEEGEAAFIVKQYEKEVANR